MALTTFTSGQVLTAAQMNAVQANDYNQTVSTKTASYTLVAADKGTRVVMNSASATTITVNTSLFSAGDTLFLQNISTGVCTVTAGTATVATAGSLAIPQNGSGILYFTSAGVSIYYPSAAVSSYTAYTPTYTNLTIGNGTNNFRYAQVGSLVHVYGQLTFGSTTSMGSQPKISLPVTAKLANDFYTNNISYVDASTTDQFFGTGYVDTTTTIRFKLPQVTGVNIFTANVGASAPFTWTTSDVINFNFVYEAA